MMNRTIACALCAIMLAFGGGCTAGERITRLSPGMSQAAVVKVLGKPDGFKSEQGFTVLKWTNKLISGWSWDTADYFVILKDGQVVEYGAGEVHKDTTHGTQAIFIHGF